MSGREEELIPPEVAAEFSARHFELLARSLGLLVVVLDPDLEITYVSREAALFLSGGVEDEFRRLWREGLRERLRRNLLRDERQVDFEIFLEPGDGVVQSCLLRVVWIGEKDCQGYVALVTPRRAAEAARGALRLASRMENLARFFRSSVHDLRAPLNAMALAVQALRVSLARRDDGGTRSQEAQYLETLKNEVDRLDRMLTRLLEETAPASNQGEKEYDLVAQMEDVASFLRPLASDSRVEIELRVPPGAEFRMVADPDRVRQVLVNLSINAIEAMPEGGRLVLAVDRVGEHCRLRIEDTGAGVPDELLSRIWGVHFTTKEKGTGIGLTVVKAVVEDLGGTVRARRLEPKGMCFEVTFPASRLRCV